MDMKQLSTRDNKIVSESTMESLSYELAMVMSQC